LPLSRMRENVCHMNEKQHITLVQYKCGLPGKRIVHVVYGNSAKTLCGMRWDGWHKLPFSLEQLPLTVGHATYHLCKKCKRSM